MKLPYWFAIIVAFSFQQSILCAEETAAQAPAAPQEQATEEEQEEQAPTDREIAAEIMALFRTGKIDEAQQRYEEALQEHPNSPALAALRYTAYIVLMRANRPDDALPHLKAFTERQMALAARTGSTSNFTQLLGMLTDSTKQQSGDDAAEKVLQEFSDKAEAIDNASPAVMAAIDAQRAVVAAKEGNADKARELIEQHYQTAKSNAEENPEDARAIRTMVSVLKNRVSVERAIDGGEVDSTQQELTEYLANAAQSQPEAAGSIYINESIGQMSMLARTSPDEAEKLLNEIKEYRENAGAEVTVAPRVDQQLAQLERMIEQAKKMNAMIGQDAPYSADTFDAWVNGEEVTEEDLKGKVVLLDFFAVWCGPCIQTFPHLRDWHDEYSDDGLVIIGVSRYHQYGWDDEANRPKQEKNISSEDEQAAMQKFVEFHELRHPVAFDPEGTTMKDYMVSGIPHVALIDRQGKLKMFRIGSGEKNAHDVEEAIKEALAASGDE